MVIDSTNWSALELPELPSTTYLPTSISSIPSIPILYLNLTSVFVSGPGLDALTNSPSVVALSSLILHSSH
jgi:hypothetical protein